MGTFPSELHALIDIEAFTKILVNLFSNAVKYAKSKVDVTLLPVKADDKSFTIEIKNDGYLIPFEMKEKIFEPFFRLKETEKQKGTGIGLALSRSLAQLQKGVLDLKEPENNMNVFFITMPLYQENETDKKQQ
jgi:signal transduction histidine kinase